MNHLLRCICCESSEEEVAIDPASGLCLFCCHTLGSQAEDSVTSGE